MIIPPCVRIEGCTPPSEDSSPEDAELDQCKLQFDISRRRQRFDNAIFFVDGARHSIDSAGMTDFRPSDIQLNLLSNASATTSVTDKTIVTTTSEVVILPSSLVTNTASNTNTTAGPSSGGGGGGGYHPHHRHHRPFPLHYRSNTGSSSVNNSPMSHSSLFTDIP